MTFAESLFKALDVTLPICLLIALGALLRKREWIDQSFVNMASTIVFKLSMPTLIFFAVINANLDVVSPNLIIYFALASLGAFSLSWLCSLWRLPATRKADRGTFVQGAFRGNGAVLGIAFATGMYGHYGASVAALLIAVLIPVYNILSVIILSIYGGGRINIVTIVAGILKNPLIDAVIIGFSWRASGLALPHWLATGGHYIGSLTVPLALLCVGASLSLDGLRESGRAVAEASFLKIIILPLLLTGIAATLGFHGAALGILFLFFGSPSATGGFIMAQTMHGNPRLAAGIIAVTTVGSMLTICSGLFLLQLLA